MAAAAYTKNSSAYSSRKIIGQGKKSVVYQALTTTTVPPAESPSRSPPFVGVYKSLFNTTTTVPMPQCSPSPTIDVSVAAKVINLDGIEPDNVKKICQELETMSTLSHENLLELHCWFIEENKLWMVTPVASGGSLESIICTRFRAGLSEGSVAAILNQILKVLCYLHKRGLAHGAVKASNVLIDSNGRVSLADFGVSARVYESISNPPLPPLIPISDLSYEYTTPPPPRHPEWISPEIVELVNSGEEWVSTISSDIWAFGFLALFLSRGMLSYSSAANISPGFREMFSKCLLTNPLDRPSADNLLKFEFFEQNHQFESHFLKVLNGLPAIEERYRDLKMLVQDLINGRRTGSEALEPYSYSELHEATIQVQNLINEYKTNIEMLGKDLEARRRPMVIQSLWESVSEAQELHKQMIKLRFDLDSFSEL